MRTRKLLLLFLFSTIAITNFRCGIEAVEATINVIEVAADLMSAIKQLDELTGLFKNNIEQLDETAAQNTKEETNIKETYQQYEQQWETIKGNYSDLNNQLQIIKDTSDRLFKGLWDNNHQIIDESRKLNDSVKNTELQVKWKNEFEKAANSLAAAKSMMNDGNDIERQLQNAAGRADLSGYLGSLEGIANEARQLSQKIETFKINADKLLNMEGMDSENSLVPPVHTDLTTPKAESPLPKINNNDTSTNPTENDVDNNNTITNAKIECHINNLRVSHGKNGNETGIGIQFDMNIVNMLNETGKCLALIKYEDGTSVKSTSDNYRSSLSDLSATETFTPNYQNANFKDFTIFIPDTAFDLPAGSFNLQVTILVSGNSSPVTIGQASSSFSYNSLIDKGKF